MSLSGANKSDAGMSYSTTLESDDMLLVIKALRTALEPFKPTAPPAPTPGP
jgi:hypothetical protein